MLLNHEQVDSIKNRKVTFIKDCLEIETFKCYDDIFNLIEFNDCAVRFNNVNINSSEVWNTNSNTIEIFNVCRNSKINSLQDLIYQLLYKDTAVTRYDSIIFMSLRSGLHQQHKDVEDVHLFGLLGTTVYRVYYEDEGEMIFEDYELERNDYLYIPCGQNHRAISKTPRAILSIGYFFS